MDPALLEIVTQGGSWLVGVIAAIVIGRQFVNFVSKDKELDRADSKEEKEKMYALMEKQNELYGQQKELLIRMDSYSREMLKGLKGTMDKMNEIQMLHTNRLDRIEDKQSQMETELRKISEKI